MRLEMWVKSEGNCNDMMVLIKRWLFIICLVFDYDERRVYL